eukprot:1175946-Prorocentrum_minimum.AAC.1
MYQQNYQNVPPPQYASVPPPQYSVPYEPTAHVSEPPQQPMQYTLQPVPVQPTPQYTMQPMPHMLQQTPSPTVQQTMQPPVQPMVQHDIPRQRAHNELEVCREWLRGGCTRDDCRYAHRKPDTNDGRTYACWDFVKGRCSRDNCKYFHPPANLCRILLDEPSPHDWRSEERSDRSRRDSFNKRGREPSPVRNLVLHHTLSCNADRLPLDHTLNNTPDNAAPCVTRTSLRRVLWPGALFRGQKNPDMPYVARNFRGPKCSFRCDLNTNEPSLTITRSSHAVLRCTKLKVGFVQARGTQKMVRNLAEEVQKKVERRAATQLMHSAIFSPSPPELFQVGVIAWISEKAPRATSCNRNPRDRIGDINVTRTHE